METRVEGQVLSTTRTFSATTAASVARTPIGRCPGTVKRRVHKCKESASTFTLVCMSVLATSIGCVIIVATAPPGAGGKRGEEGKEEEEEEEEEGGTRVRGVLHLILQQVRSCSNHGSPWSPWPAAVSMQSHPAQTQQCTCLAVTRKRARSRAQSPHQYIALKGTSRMRFAELPCHNERTPPRCI